MDIAIARRARLLAAYAVAGGVGLATAAQDATEKSSPCRPLSCAGVDLGPFLPPEGWKFIPDRRPVAVITLSNGGYGLNDLGQVPWWFSEGELQDDGYPYGAANNGVPDAFDELLYRMDDLYNVGFRRIQLRLPAGNFSEEANFADSAQWWPMEPWRRDGFLTVVKQWIDEKAAEGDPAAISIYAGYKVADPCTPGMHDAVAPDYKTLSGACTMYQNVRPWIEAGIAEYWFDNSSVYWRDMKDLQHSADYADRSGPWRAKIKIGGEAVPATTGSCATGPDRLKVPEPAALAAGAWVASYRFARSRYTYNDAFVEFDPINTEVGLMLTSQRTPPAELVCGPAPHNSPAGKMWDFADARRFYETGWVLWGTLLYSEKTFSPILTDPDNYTFDYPMPRGRGVEAIFRLYSFGPITALADFNGDGLIEGDAAGADFVEFFDVWAANSYVHGRAATYLNGDVNGDGKIDVLDATDFLAAADLWRFSRVVVGMDLGNPSWVR